ncbi:hypothetical protein CASFOL_041906 [Castilleja foliolosa]|uniref:NAC domain-containing protein n=1 Tax=Castilleja foliolosa TaxID=1961234 RepID=A0ABD3BAB2_9LAMI
MEGEAKKDEKLPAGFRFHPTDEELITCYLMHKISDANFTGRAIADVDLNKCEPWDLPGKAKMGEKEYYFFSLRDRKYPTGVRTNRATNTGYWKTTGKDKEIYDSNSSELIGMKKTLVFYKGRAPRGEKSNWVMHEFRIHSRVSGFRNTKQDEWVVCRVFQKSPSGAKKYPSNHHSSRPSIIINPYMNNPYNLEPPHHHNPIYNPQMIINHPEFNHNFQFPPEIQELNKPFFIGSTISNSSSSGGSSMMANFQTPPQLINYNVGPAGGGNDEGCFTISGLNLRLGGARAAAQPLVRPDLTSSSGFMGMDQCADLDNYWPSY